MTDTILLCLFCRHLEEGSTRCEAFPEGIPDDLLFSPRDHRGACSHGVCFGLKPGEEVRFGEWLALEQARSNVCGIRAPGKR
jgi:hypothetical protein